MAIGEITKLEIEYYKHLNTLSTGSIVIVVSFLERISEHSNSRLLIAIALASFMLSLLSTVSVYSINVVFAGESFDDTPRWALRLKAFSLIITWGGFLIGVFSLGLFGILNL